MGGMGQAAVHIIRHKPAAATGLAVKILGETREKVTVAPQTVAVELGRTAVLRFEQQKRELGVEARIVEAGADAVGTFAWQTSLY